MNMRSIAVAVSLSVAAAHPIFSQGPLTPPGPPAPTMKSLEDLDTKLNQADAKAEKRTPITSLPFTISAPGSYYLTGNLTGVTGQNGIAVDVNNVTIDLNGFSLNGPGDNGIVANGAVTIRNGSVSGWAQAGITVSGPGVLIQNIHASNNASRGISAGSRAVVQSCTVTNSGTNAGGRGISVADGSIISKCVVTGTSGAASIAIAAGVGCLVVDCTGRDNDATGGHVIFTGASTIVERCEATLSDGVAAAISTGANCRVIDCIAANNPGATTIGINANTRSTITGCNAVQNGADGFVIADNSAVINNTASANSGDGFEIFGSRNRVEGNHATSNTGAGFHVNNDTPPTDNLIIRNSSGSNAGLEFDVITGNVFAPVAPRADVTNGTNTNPHANFDLD